MNTGVVGYESKASLNDDAEKENDEVDLDEAIGPSHIVSPWLDMSSVKRLTTLPWVIYSTKKQII